MDWTVTRMALLVAWVSTIALAAPTRGELAAQLRAEGTRDAAFCALARRQVWATRRAYWMNVSECPHLNAVLEAPLGDGRSLFVVFKAGLYESVLPGEPFGGFELLLSDGRFVAPFGNANVVEPDEPPFAYDGVHLALPISNSYDGGVQAVHIVPVTLAQRPVLTVLFPETTADARWEFRVEKRGDQWPVVAVGVVKPDGEFDARARYTWSAEQKAYVGPEGGPEQDFMRVQHAPGRDVDLFAAVARFRPGTVTQRRARGARECD